MAAFSGAAAPAESSLVAASAMVSRDARICVCLGIVGRWVFEWRRMRALQGR